MSPKTVFNCRTDPVDLFREVESALLDPNRCRWRDHREDGHVRHFTFEEFAHRSVDPAANLQLRRLVGRVEGQDAARITPVFRNKFFGDLPRQAWDKPQEN